MDGSPLKEWPFASCKMGHPRGVDNQKVTVAITESLYAPAGTSAPAGSEP